MSIPVQNVRYSNTSYFAIQPCFSQCYVIINYTWIYYTYTILHFQLYFKFIFIQQKRFVLLKVQETKKKMLWDACWRTLKIHAIQIIEQFRYVHQSTTYSKNSISSEKQPCQHNVKKFIIFNLINVKRQFYCLGHVFTQIKTGSSISISCPTNIFISWQSFYL